MKKLFSNEILALFLIWKVSLFLTLLFAIIFIPLAGKHFFGGGLQNYLSNPFIYAWANFDGEHYLSIAEKGYSGGEQAFFPLYPFLLHLLTLPFSQNPLYFQITGLLVSHAALLLALVGIFKLVQLDFKKSVAQLTLILIMVFPTSFYFGSIYTESLFLALSVWTLYLSRKGYWFWAGILGGLASATRFIGVILLPVLAIEWFLQRKSLKDLSVIVLLLIPVGLLSYMYYLNQTVGDPLAFFHTLSGFGEQRSTTPIVLPQVFWRYIKIFMDLPKNDPYVFTFMLELGTAILFLITSILAFLKLRLSYAVFIFLGFLIPTLSGSFSSLPRYVIVLFPAFILFALLLDKKPLWQKITLISLSSVLLLVTSALYFRGYWIS